MKKKNSKHPASYRDPCGFVFFHEGELYRQVNLCYREHYDYLISSGLYKKLIKDGLLIPHEEVNVPSPEPSQVHRVIKPERIPFTSYPYEWCFSQLKDAALITLKIQKTALDHGMVLKDATPYNIQFYKGKPVLIDTLSFEIYRDGEPWRAYRQFCQGFLAPLVLAAYTDLRTLSLFRIFHEEYPLDFVASLLPSKTKFRPGIFTHIHLHAGLQTKMGMSQLPERKIGKNALYGMVEALQGIVEGLKPKIKKSVWSSYYEQLSYTSGAFEDKKKVVEEWIRKLSPSTVWDLGANVGIFSRISASCGVFTMSFDMDPVCVEVNYTECKKKGEVNILPLVMDLTNPSPGIGWENKERESFIERGPCDTALALALVHHLAIGRNVPFEKMAQFFSRICKNLIIEFIPPDDERAKLLLSRKKENFEWYNLNRFEKTFSRFFIILERKQLKDSSRVLYLMGGKG